MGRLWCLPSATICIESICSDHTQPFFCSSDFCCYSRQEEYISFTDLVINLIMTTIHSPLSLLRKKRIKHVWNVSVWKISEIVFTTLQSYVTTKLLYNRVTYWTSMHIFFPDLCPYSWQGIRMGSPSSARTFSMYHSIEHTTLMENWKNTPRVQRCHAQHCTQIQAPGFIHPLLAHLCLES